MKIAVIGSGGREHALVWRLGLDVGPENVVCIPGNAGIPNSLNLAPQPPADPTNAEGWTVERGLAVALAAQGVDLVVIGPEAPLTKGLADRVRDLGIPAFGPGADGAVLEGSKVWSKEFMQRHGVATARFETAKGCEEARAFARTWQGGVVVKFDGLAGGKGVWVCDAAQAALEAIDEAEKRYGPDAPFVLEEKLVGQELSILGLTDGTTVRLLSPSQDHKQLLDGDLGPNTGGMGAFTPVSWVTPAMLEQIDKAVVQPTLAGLKADGISYRGVIYFGLMMTPDGPKLLEYNVRFGDPEAEVVLPKLAGSLADVLLACAEGRLHEVEVQFHPGTIVDVVMVSCGYPDSYPTGRAITGLDRLSKETMVFHSGTRLEGGTLVTAGGRVLNIVCRGETLDEALVKAYEEIHHVTFEGAFFRKDIGRRRWDQ